MIECYHVSDLEVTIYTCLNMLCVYGMQSTPGNCFLVLVPLSQKEYMSLVVFVCLSVCLSATMPQKVTNVL